MNPVSKTRTLTGLVLSFSLILAATFFLAPLFKYAGFDNYALLFYSRLFFWLIVLLTYLFAVKIERQPYILWPEQKYPFSYYVISIMSVMGIMLLGSAIISLVLYYCGINNKSESLNKVVLLLHNDSWMVLFFAVTAGITEELIFRVYFLSRLKLLLNNNYLPIIISALLFGLVHIKYATVVQVLVPLFIGVVFALHYQKYRNIKILIIAHFLWDYLFMLLRTR